LQDLRHAVALEPAGPVGDVRGRGTLEVVAGVVVGGVDPGLPESLGAFAAVLPRAHSRPVIACRRSHQTRHTASRTIFRDIFDSPKSRSAKRIGTSTRSNPFRNARYLSSIWNAYPSERTRSSSTASSTSRRQQMKPPVASRTGMPVIVRAYHDPK